MPLWCIALKTQKIRREKIHTFKFNLLFVGCIFHYFIFILFNQDLGCIISFLNNCFLGEKTKIQEENKQFFENNLHYDYLSKSLITYTTVQLILSNVHRCWLAMLSFWTGCWRAIKFRRKKSSLYPTRESMACCLFTSISFTNIHQHILSRNFNPFYSIWSSK